MRPHRDWYAEGFRYEELETLQPGNLFTVSYVELEEVETVGEIRIEEWAVIIDGRVFPRHYKTWVKHFF